MSNEHQKKEYLFTNTVKHTEARKGILAASGKADIEFATPPDFEGHEGFWSPEDMYVASVNACMMTTFLYFTNKAKLDFVSYESQAEGVLSKTPSGLRFTKVTIKPCIQVTSTEDKEKVEKLLVDTKKHCLVSNSMNAEITVDAQVTVKD